MWYSRLFWRLFLAYAGLIILTISVCVAIVADWQEDRFLERVQRNLRHSAILVRSEFASRLSEKPREADQQKLRDLGMETKTRFTLVSKTGKVLADSEQANLTAVKQMENHLGRSEFIEAAAHGEGSVQRTSPTLGIPFLYYAVAIQEEGKLVGFVRAAQPVEQLREQIEATRRLFGFVGLLVGLAGLLVVYLLTRRIVRPVYQLTEAVQDIATGEYPQRINVRSGDELGVLARSFERMSKELNDRETQLRESNERQATVLGGMTDGVLAVDADQRILFANVASAKMLGFSPDEVEGRPLIEVARNHELREIVFRALSTQTLCQGEIEWLPDDTTTFNVLATPLPGAPCPGVVLVLHDITELKRLESLRQQFIANVSHELKTPLSSIKAYAETLYNGAIHDADHAKRFLSCINEQADRLNDLISDMLTLARIEAEHAMPEIADLSLRQVVQARLADWQARATATGVALHDQTSIRDILLRGDEDSLTQILDNLVDNALKYTPAGGSVTLDCRQEGDLAVIEVADTGIGIAKEHHARLFERFYRVDKARSRELGGTGLGLAIVKHLCQAQGGTVTVESGLGHGSTFRVFLPAASALEANGS